MKCTRCGHSVTCVINSRSKQSEGSDYLDDFMVMRRRECKHCEYRFTTHEKPIEDEKPDIFILRNKLNLMWKT